MKKRIISLALCMALVVSTLFTGVASISATAETTPASAKILSEELKGYRRIVPSDLSKNGGDSRMMMEDSDGDDTVLTLQKDGRYNYQNGLSGKNYFDFDINFNKKNDAQIIWLAKTTEAYRSNLFMRYRANDYFRLDKYGDDQKVTNLLWTKTGISDTEYFNVKLLTDVTKTSVSSDTENVYYQLWVNDSYIGEGNVTLAAHESCMWVKGDSGVTMRDPIVNDAKNAFDGYERVSLNDFVYANGGSVSVNDGFAGYRISAAAYKSATVEAEDSYSLDKTYLDFDMKTVATTNQLMSLYNRQNWHDYIRVNWYNTTSLCLSYVYVDAKGGDTVDPDTQKTVQFADFGITAGEYFNLKIRTDFTANADDSTKRDAVIQFWLNDKFAHEMRLTATNLRNGLFCSGNTSDSFYVKEPTLKPIMEEEFEGYERIDMFDYLCTGPRVIDPATGIMGFASANDEARALFTDFNKKYLDIYANFAGVSNSFIQYAAPSKSRSCFRFDFTSQSNFRFAYYDEAQNLHTLANLNINDFNASWDEYFNIKLRTDVESLSSTTDRIKVQLWINDMFAFEGKADIIYQSAKEKIYIYIGNGTNIKTDIDETTNLKSYKKAVLDDFQNLGAPRNESGTVYSSGVTGKYAYNDLNNTYLNVDLKVPNALNPFMSLLSKNVDNQGFWGDNEQVRLLLEGTTLKLTTVHEGKSVYTLTLGNISNAPYNYSADEFFNLKVRTKIYDTGVIGYLVYVNDQLLNCAYIGANTDNTNKFLPLYSDSVLSDMNFVGIRGAGGVDISARTPIENEKLPDASFDLANGSYLLTGADEFIVNGVGMNAGDTLTVSGDYVIERIIEGKVASTQTVSLYRIGDVNLDGNVFVTGTPIWQDYYALEAIIKYSAVTKASEKAADLNNDGKVDQTDLSIMLDLRKDVSKATATLAEYFGNGLTYDYLGGRNVMPIGGFYGPDTSAKTSEETYRLISEAGINVITLLPFQYNDGDDRDFMRNLDLAEKYGIGVFVNDANLNKLTKDGDNVINKETLTSASELANAMKKYSAYSSFLGINIIDEPKWDSDTRFSENYYGKFKYYKDAVNALNPFANVTGYINLHGAGSFERNDYKKYLNSVVNDLDVLSFDCYPYFDKDATTPVSYKLYGYLESLDATSAVAKANNKPFWSYIQAGTDFRDDGDDSQTSGYYTMADTLWNVNTSLAFGAKGITYFPMMQPSYFSNDATKADGHDYNRNGIIGANGETTIYYDMVKRANTQIKAIDDVLMNAQNNGVVAIGNALTDVSGASSQRNYTFESIIERQNNKYTDKLVDVSSNKNDGAMVGCFDYNNTEAYYVVNYSRTVNDTQNIKLTFEGNNNVRIIKDGVEYTCDLCNSLQLNLESGEGILVVLGDSSEAVFDSDVSGFVLETSANVNGADYPTGTVFTDSGEYYIIGSKEFISYETQVIVYKSGDINSDSNIDILDLVCMKQHIANLRTITQSGIWAENSLEGSGAADKLASLVTKLLGVE